MTKKSEIGKSGENKACEYLENKGYEILIRNYRQKFGEIDIIARAQDLTLVFIEVKTILINEVSLLSPEDNLTTQKYNKVNRMGGFFAGEYPGAVNEERGWRIDLVAVEFSQNGEYVVRHYENI